MNGILNRQTAVILRVGKRKPTTYKVVEAINNRVLITFITPIVDFKTALKTLKPIV